MRIIELDAKHWTTTLEFYRDLLSALGAPPKHGVSIDAVLDSVVWGGMNAIDPPYKIRVSGTASLPISTRNKIELLKAELDKELEFRRARGHEVDVEFEILS